MRGESGNVRLKLAAEPTETVLRGPHVRQGARLKGPHEHLSWVTFDPALAVAGGTPQLTTAAKTFEPFKTHVNPTNDSDREFELLGLTLEWDIGWATLKSITAQQDFDDFVVADRDLTDVPLFDIWDDSTIDTFTQEINVLGSSDKLDWVLGAFYLREEWDRHIVFQQRASRVWFSRAEPVRLFATSYGHGLLVLVPRRDLGGHRPCACQRRAVRRTEDEIDEYHVNEGRLPLFNLTIPFCDKAEQLDWGATTIRVVGQYDVNDNGNVYVSYTEGYKAGGVAPVECNVPYEPETVDAYEVGYKAMVGGSTTLSAAAFYYDYSDFQVSQIIGISPVTRNAGDAEVRGLELELSSTLTENWLVSGAVALLDTEYGDFINLDGLQAELGFQNNKGNPLNNAPKTSINLGVALYHPRCSGAGGRRCVPMRRTGLARISGSSKTSWTRKAPTRW